MDQALSQADTLVVAVTLETFLFTALTLVLAFGDVRNRVPNLPVSPETLGYFAVVLVTITALGALSAWWTAMAHPWPCGFLRAVETVSVLVGIAGQPLFAWAIARGLSDKR